MPETGIEQNNEEAKPGLTDTLSSHLLGGKKKHDETKNVESDEVQHLQKGTDYLTTFLLQQGIQQTPKTVSANKPKGVDELKKDFVENLVKNGFVNIGDDGRTVLTDKGQEYLTKQTRNAEMKVTLAKLINLRYRNSIAKTRKKRSSGKKTRKGTKKSAKRKKKR
ncbi:uncharacterized protein METZ01_LOCUS173440 [marine metagenome]|uniref:Uncharacterized protein n=1 Tax=marine metagenome TaxID=408172 RepID=A0A382C3C9_9ZZZZ